jgi:hypothetical protein
MAIVRQHDKRSGITYAYESISHWDKEKKVSVKVSPSSQLLSDMAWCGSDERTR